MVKKVFIGFAGIILVLLLVGFILPGTIETSKSISINAPAEYVFEEINDLERNANWSYWNNLYRDNMTVIYGDVRSGAGAFSAWDGPESGQGNMVIVESIPNQSVKIDLDFMEQGTAQAWYTFEPEGEGTKLTAGFISNLGMNPLMRWIGVLMIKPEIEKASDYNLTRLKEIAETKPKFTVAITEVVTDPVHYVGLQTSMSFEDLTAVSEQMGKSYGELLGLLRKAKVEVTGPPFCLYPYWDEVKKEMEMICALPVPADAKLPPKYIVAEVPAGKAVKAIHTGDYHKLGETHDQLDKYVEFKKLEIVGDPWEVYVTGPETEPDQSKWVTEVYYPVKASRQ